ncbi:MAG: galactose mutarotase [Acidobacteria bacterium]|nr:galactose mutarotase [Acidobacteriota bacterium]
MRLKTATTLLSLLALSGLFSACEPKTTEPAKAPTTEIASKGAEAKLKKESFGKLPDGTEVDSYTLSNKNGVEVKITNYGATVTSIKAPDRNGKFDDVTLGYDNIAGYLDKNPHLGALAGRYANRIAKGEFKLGGKTYTLAKNNGPNHLHGGPKGFYQQLWKATDATGKDGVAVKMTYLSKDGEEGYPGNLEATVTYTLTDQNELKIDYMATTDKETVVNLTNHSYFNLAGAGSGDVLNHQLKINSKQTTEIDKTLIPTGKMSPVAGTPFDFGKLTAIGAHINDKNEQLEIGQGYDHNFVLDTGGNLTAQAVEVYEPTTGRVMEVFTDQPGVQLYTANHLDGTIIGKGGKTYNKRGAFCLETQHYPDSPNKPNFPTTVLKPGDKYQTTTIYKFSAR